MITRNDVVREARSWLSTPYQHQQHDRGVATDCAGLIGGVAIGVGALAADFWETRFSAHAGYGRQPAQGLLEQTCDLFLLRIALADAGVGDVVGFRFRRETMHLGFLVPYAHGGHAVVHALSPAGMVVEHRLDDRWRDRITHAWRVPGVA